jgi:hypothetical protein
VINISNFTSKDNPPWGPPKPPKPPEPAEPAQPARPARSPQPRAPAEAAAATPASPAGFGPILAIVGRVLLSWLAAIPRRLGDRLFVMNDTEAYWRGWQIAKTHGGLARRYRDLRFDTLAECPKCHGAGSPADLPCGPCLGTGRITLGEVS